MKKLSNESGMGVVEVILILVVVGIIGFTGWFVWQSQKSTSETLDSANNSETAKPIQSEKATDATADDTKTNTLTVKEWGVTFEIPASLYGTSVSYAKRTVGTSDMMEFTTDKLTSLGCTFGSYGSDAVFRDTSSRAGEVDTIPLNDDKPVDSYYYYVVGSRSSCSSNSADMETETAQRSALQDMFKTIKAE